MDEEEEDVLATSRAFAVRDQIPAHTPSLCFLLSCLLLSLPVPVPANRPSLFSWVPFPKGPQLQPLSPARRPPAQPSSSLRVTAKALPHSIIPHTEILVAPVSCGPKLLQCGLR